MSFCTTCGANVNGAFCPQCGTPIGAAGTPPPPPAQQQFSPPPAYSAAGTPAPPPAQQQFSQPPPYGAPGTPAPPPAQQQFSQPPPYGAPAPMPMARKTSPLVWVLVIILGLFFLGCIAVVGFGFFVAHKVKEAGIDPDLWRSNPGLAVGKIIAATNPNVEVVRSDDHAGTVTIRDKRTGKETTMTFDQARNGKFSITADDDHGGTATMQFGGSGANTNLPSWVPKYPGSEGTSNFAIKASGNGGDGGTFAFTTPDSRDKVLKFYRDKAQDLGLKLKMTTDAGDASMVVATEDNGRSLTVIVGAQDGSTTVSVTYGSK